MRKETQPRPGVAAVWLLVMIVAVSAVSALVMSEVLKSRDLAAGRESELRAEWLARGALEYGLLKLGDNPVAGSAQLPGEWTPGAKATVTWTAGESGAWILRAEASAGEIPAFRRLAFTMPAARKGSQWVPSGPVTRTGGTPNP